MKARAYDLMYRLWAPWDSVGVRQDLLALLETGAVSPATHRRVIDLGCGTGANVVHLAQSGFDVVGVDFSPVALEKARNRADKAGLDSGVSWVQTDLTSSMPEVAGPFDVLLDFGTLDDLRGVDRGRMADNITRLSHSDSVLLEYCFYAFREDLPRFSFRGPSRSFPGIEPGELEELFGANWKIELRASYPDYGTAAFVLTRRRAPDSEPK